MWKTNADERLVDWSLLLRSDPRYDPRYVDYQRLTGPAGSVSQDEQRRLRASSVFVCGVGGMGGAAVQSLVRAGVGNLTITDPDCFELSGLDPQSLAVVDPVGVRQPTATHEPLRLEVLGSDWVELLDHVLPRHRVVVNGLDDMRAGIQLYRKAREHGATVIDAYLSPYPCVTVVEPHDPRGVEEIAIGRRPSSSFAPVVVAAGKLMAFEAIGRLLGRDSEAGCEGYLRDPWGGRPGRPGRGPRRAPETRSPAGPRPMNRAVSEHLKVL